MKARERSRVIILTSILGIVLNMFLVIGKALVGYLTNSIAIIVDAVNNLTDAMSSIVTIIGTKLANKKPDQEHPLGHGRIEYLATLVIAVFIIYAGVSAFSESIKRIISGELPDYNMWSIIVVIFAIVIKIFIWFYYKVVGNKVKSQNLINSGVDAGFDVVISVSTLVAALIFMFSKGAICIEAYLAIGISILIMKSGISMIRETASIILGERIDKELVTKVKKVATSFKEVKGVYDITLNNYGPDNYIGSFHIEVDDKMNAIEIDNLTRRITNKVFTRTGVIVSAIGIYSLNVNDKKAVEMKKQIEKLLKDYPEVLSMHGFYVNHEEKTINLDLVISFNCEDMEKSFDNVLTEIRNMFEDYDVYGVLDLDLTD